MREALVAVDSIAAPLEAGAGILLDDEIEFLGCRSDEAVRRGEDVEFTCYFIALQRPSRDYEVFVHVTGDRFIHADHPPVAGLSPSREWEPGELVRDVFRVHVPADQPGDRLVPRIGLYSGSHRAQAELSSEAAGVIDPEGRIVLPTIRISE